MGTTDTGGGEGVARPASPGLPGEVPGRGALLRLAGLAALGGALGTATRAVLEHAFSSAPGSWPWTTFAINLLGSLALGVLIESVHAPGADRGWRRAVRVGCGTGVVGGFTTYSTFVIEIEQLAEHGRLASATAYAATSVALGVAAACAGIAIVRAARSRLGVARGEG